jgi:hypothetical protein
VIIQSLSSSEKFNYHSNPTFQQQNSVPEPDIQRSYSPVVHGWVSESNREKETNDNDNEQLIEANDDDTPRHQEPYMRATKAVSQQNAFD